MEESSSDSPSDVFSERLTQPSYNESQVLNEETDSEIKSIDDEISPNSHTNIFSETSLSQQSHTDTSSLASAKEVEDMSASSVIGNNESQDLDTQLELILQFPRST